MQQLKCLLDSVSLPSLLPQWAVRVGSDASLSSLIGFGEIEQLENELFGTKVQRSVYLNAYLVLQAWLWFMGLLGKVGDLALF